MSRPSLTVLLRQHGRAQEWQQPRGSKPVSWDAPSMASTARKPPWTVALPTPRGTNPLPGHKFIAHTQLSRHISQANVAGLWVKPWSLARLQQQQEAYAHMTTAKLTWLPCG